MKILKWIIVLPFIALVLYILARFAFCRENYFTVKTATPMVEKIADYIVVNGVPESLDKIPDLPNELDECKKNISYEKEVDLDNIKVNSKEKSDFSIIEEKCNFFYKGKKYKVWFWFAKHYTYLDRTHGKLDIRSNKTSVGTSFEVDEKNTLKHDISGSSFDNRFGFCRQFRQ